MNPLAWFRENQKSTVAFFTVLLMAGFGALGVLSNVASNNSGGPAVEAKDMIQWTNGKLSDVELEQIWRQRRLVSEFETRLSQAIRKKTDKPIFLGGSLAFAFVAGQRESSDPNATRQVDEQTLQVLIYEKEAEKLGIQATDDVLMNTIVSACQQRLTDDEIRQVARFDGGSSLASILHAMRREFKAKGAFSALETRIIPTSNTPMEAYMAWERLQKKADCSVLELNVEDYLKDVKGKPSDSELRKLFEQGQYKVKSANGEDPGFRTENQLAFGYFEADREEITKRFVGEITDEEAKKEYDKLVSLKDPLVYIIKKAPSSPDLGPIPGSEKGTESEEKKSEQPALTAPGSEKNEVGSEKKTETKTDLPPTPTGSDKNKKDAPAKKVSLSKSNVLHYVSVASVQDKDQKKEEAKAAEKTAVEKPKTETKTEATEAKDQETKKPETTSKPADTTEPVSEVRTFEEVKDQIKSRLANPKVDKFITDSFREIKTLYVDEHSYDLMDFRNNVEEAKREGKPEPSKPSDLDFDAVVKNYDGIRFQKTPLMKFEEFSKTEIGKQSDFQQTLAQAVFRSFVDVSPYEAIDFQAISAQQKYYPFVIEKSEGGVVDFETAKSDILDFWKQQEALKLAEKDAKSKAEEVEASGKKLLAVFEDGKETGSFSWYVTRRSQGFGGFGSQLDYSYGFPNNTFAVERKFMEKVFSMKAGEVSFATNVLNNRVYVVQKNVDSIETEKERLNKFLENWGTFSQYPQAVNPFTQFEIRSENRKRLRKLYDQYQVKFLK